MAAYTIRASALPGWNDCPRRESIGLFYKIITAAGFEFQKREHHVAAAMGTGVHSGAVHALREKITGLATSKLKDIVEISISSFRAEIKDGVFYDASSPTVNTCEKQVENLTRAFMGDVFLEINPTEIEIALASDLHDDFSLSGHADILTSVPGIDDLKFGAVNRRYDSQLGAYAVLARKNGHPLPSELRIIHIPRTPLAKPQKAAVITRYNIRECIAEASAVCQTIIGQMTHFIATCDPSCFPCNPSSILCSRRYCAGFCNKTWCKFGE